MTLGKTYNFYFDTYGNVIGVDELASNYAVLDTLYMEHSKGVDTAYGDLYFFDADSKTDATITKLRVMMLLISKSLLPRTKTITTPSMLTASIRTALTRSMIPSSAMLILPPTIAVTST